MSPFLFVTRESTANAYEEVHTHRHTYTVVFLSISATARSSVAAALASSESTGAHWGFCTDQRGNEDNNARTTEMTCGGRFPPERFSVTPRRASALLELNVFGCKLGVEDPVDCLSTKGEAMATRTRPRFTVCPFRGRSTSTPSTAAGGRVIISFCGDPILPSLPRSRAHLGNFLRSLHRRHTGDMHGGEGGNHGVRGDGAAFLLPSAPLGRDWHPTTAPLHCL